jgi:SAM-dependent methyltransferase
MTLQVVSFKKPAQETYEGRKIMTDPGVHGAVAAEISKSLEANSSILEIGAGAGAFTLRLKNSGYTDISATDIDDEFFDISDIDYRKVTPSDSLAKIFTGKEFDAVIAIEVIEHFRGTWYFLEEVASVLKSGGRLILTTPNISSLYSRMIFLKEGRFFHFQGKDSWDMGHINPVPFFVIEQMANDLGFDLVSRQAVGYMPILDWSGFRMRNLFTFLPRLLLTLMMSGPGPKEGNILLYSFIKR